MVLEDGKVYNMLYNDEHAIILEDINHNEVQANNEEQNTVAVCDVCGKSFKSKAHLRVHFSIHKHGQFSCEPCNKSFTAKIKLTDHERFVHS